MHRKSLQSRKYILSDTAKTSSIMKRLTKRENEIMNLFWDRGAMFVKELQSLYPEPQPHINTLSTMVRILESNGFLSHKAYGNTYQYYPVISREEYGRNSLSGIISNYLGNSYLNAVSELVREEKITVEELKALISEIEKTDSGHESE